MSNILLFIVITLIIFLIFLLHEGLLEISKSLNDMYILYFDEISSKDDSIDLNFKER